MKTDPEVRKLIQRYPALAECEESVMAMLGGMTQCFEKGGRIYLCGNGGSASDAEHWAGELLKGFYSKRPLSKEEQARFPDDTGSRLQGGLPAIPLIGFTALRTAVANDMAGELEYAQLVWAMGREGDILVGISTSGNAKNVAAAASAAKARGMTVMGLTGRHGGKLATMADVCVKAPADRTHEIQEYHLAIYHAVCLGLENHFFPGK